ncbi:MAG TPA: hypothetical protein VK508_04730 [Cyclobacteriaceae bacterium]|nr:hypothetical protein [Cyclobacteriaceae bacterium]
MDERLKFDEYRFHFRPLVTPDLFNSVESVDDLMSNKTVILREILQSQITFTHRNRQLNYLYTDLGDDLHQFRIANVRTTKIEQDFEEVVIENEPSATLFLWNNPNEQKILIESDKTSFQESKVVGRLLERTLNERLKPHKLALSIKLEIEQSEFWQLVKKYEGKITEIEFNLLYPNLPKSHSVISEELEAVFKSINSPEGSVKFKSENGQALTNLVESNQQINSLNTAASLQGMPIVIKVKQEKGKKKTGKSRKSFTITLPTDTPALAEIIKSIME